MPITPFHFGPGALVSVASPRYVSFLSFCAVNVLIDVESLYNMLTEQARIHTFFHTYIGATLAAVGTVVLFLLARWAALQLPDFPFLRWRNLGIVPVATGATIGAWSHVALDSIMHSDITPLAPLSDANVLYRVVSLSTLHLSCLAAAGAAAAWLAVRSNKSLERRRDA